MEVVLYLIKIPFCSIKYVTQSIKDDDKSPLFTKSGKLSGLSLNIYDLLLSGLKGTLKKDAVLSVLKEISVSNLGTKL